MSYLRCFSVFYSLLCLLSTLSRSIECAKLTELLKWRELNYDWSTVAMRESALQSGFYKPDNNLPLGMDVWRNRVFFSVPRWRSGVASSLNYIDLSSDQPELFHPYPGWVENLLNIDDLKTTGNKSPSSIISSFRIAVDECDRLWVMDTGKEDILGANKIITVPALVIFDLKTDTFIRRYEFSNENSPFGVVMVDILNGDCANAYAYISDFIAGSLFVYSYAENRSWQIKHDLFKYDENHYIHHLADHEYPWKAGIFGLALGIPNSEGFRTVYINSISSLSAYTVSTKVLKNEAYALSPESITEYTILGYRQNNEQATCQVFDRNTNVLMYMLVDMDGMGCWNTKKSYSAENRDIVDRNAVLLAFPNELKMDGDRNVWVLSNSMPLYFAKKMNYSEFNYRLLRGSVDEILDGTVCV